MAAATDRVTHALRAHGVAVDILESPGGTRTAEQAAAAVGASVGQIVKSLVFLADSRPVLALVSGANRVDLMKLARACDAHAARRADADTVRRVTGYAIGGVPPLAHAEPMAVVIDGDLLAFDRVYAAAGTPHAVFAVDPRVLQRITSAVVADIRET